MTAPALRLPAFVLAALAVGCARLPRAPQVSPAEFPHDARWLEYPAALRAQTRGIVKAMGREYDMNGYVVAKEPGSVRLRAYSEMGGTLFDVATDGATPHVIENAAGLRKSWLLRGALRDAQFLFLSSPAQTAAAFCSEDGIGWSQPAPEGRELRFICDETESPRAVMLLNEGRIEWEAEFGELAALPEWPHRVPVSVHVKDHRIGYTLELSVLDLKPMVAPDELFREPAP